MQVSGLSGFFEALVLASLERREDKVLLRGILSGCVWNGFLLCFVRGEIVPCRFCGGPESDGHLFWECPHLPFFILVIVLSFVIFCLWIRVLDLGVFFGMVSCLHLLALVGLLLGLLRMMMLLMLGWRDCWVLALKACVREWVPSDHFLADLAASDVYDHPDV